MRKKSDSESVNSILKVLLITDVFYFYVIYLRMAKNKMYWEPNIQL
jgi:hypothetical protein